MNEIALEEEHDDNILDGLGIEIELAKPDDFLKVKETLTRIGIGSKREKKLRQSCYLLHKRGRYFIMHFLELFKLDGKNSNFNDEDRARRNIIANLLESWGLVAILEDEKERIAQDPKPNVRLTILPFKEKANWTLIYKHSIGR